MGDINMFVPDNKYSRSFHDLTTAVYTKNACIIYYIVHILYMYKPTYIYELSTLLIMKKKM